MHISPALVCWAWRWYPDPSVVKFDQMSAEQLKAYNTASWWDIGVLSMSSYMIWVVLYYIKVRALPVFSQGRVLLTDHLSGSSTMTSPVWWPVLKGALLCVQDLSVHFPSDVTLSVTVLLKLLYVW
jgi:hypothetical protein